MNARVFKLFNIMLNIPLLRSTTMLAREATSYSKYSRRKTFSQHGEDQFLTKYFSGKENGCYIDVGASHPFRLSNTYMLYRQGWHGICVEPIRNLCNRFRIYRPRDIVLNAAVSSTSSTLEFYEMIPSVLSTFDETVFKQRISEGCVLHSKYAVKTFTLAEIFSKYATDRPVSLLSIDVEGLDYQVLSSNDWAKYRPELVIFEKNDQANNLSDDLMVRSGYSLLTVLGCNAVYRRDVNAIETGYTAIPVSAITNSN